MGAKVKFTPSSLKNFVKSKCSPSGFFFFGLTIGEYMGIWFPLCGPRGKELPQKGQLDFFSLRKNDSIPDPSLSYKLLVFQPPKNNVCSKMSPVKTLGENFHGSMERSTKDVCYLENSHGEPLPKPNRSHISYKLLLPVGPVVVLAPRNAEMPIKQLMGIAWEQFRKFLKDGLWIQISRCRLTKRSCGQVNWTKAQGLQPPRWHMCRTQRDVMPLNFGQAKCSGGPNLFHLTRTYRTWSFLVNLKFTGLWLLFRSFAATLRDASTLVVFATVAVHRTSLAVHLQWHELLAGFKYASVNNIDALL